MFRIILKNNAPVLCLLSAIVVLVAAFWFSGLAQAQSQPKIVELKDAVERVSPNQIRAKSGFRLIVDGDGWIVEQAVGKEVRRLEKRVKCGSCPGGTCRSKLNGSCVPRNSCTSQGCLIDPF